MRRFSKKSVDPILPWKNMFLVKHYEVNWSKVSTKNSIQKITPLFRINVYFNVNMSMFKVKGKNPIILNSNYWKNATRHKQVSIHRTAILKTLSTYINRYSSNTLINIYLLPTSVLVPSQEIAKHLESLFKQKIVQFQSYSKPSKQPKEAGRRQVGNKLECFQYLFPFRYNLWMQYMVKNTFLKEYLKIHVKVNNVNSKIDSRGHWIMAHHYVVYFSHDLHNLGADLINFLKLIKKFNFFQYLSIPQVHSYSMKTLFALCIRFVRCLKWSSKQSQDYIVFLLKTHSHLDMIQILQDFQEVYASYLKSKYNRNSLQVKSQRTK